MKGILICFGAGLLATTLAVAQDMPANGSEAGKTGQSGQSSQSYQTSSGVIRGCLSGSAGNYTITDQNGMQYQINGPDNQLQASVGHEVEVTTRQDQASATDTEPSRTTSTTTNSVQVSNLRDIASSCTPGHPSSASPTENDNGATPKGTPDAAEPPQPQQMAMLQQQSRPDLGSTPPSQAAPPVTSQTPATPGASTDSTQQGTPSSSTSSSTTTTTTTDQQNTNPSTTTGMTGSQVNQNAQGARQGQMNATPQTSNSAQGTTNQATGTSSTTTNTTTTNTQQQQPNANDQNKPLYERQATDIPWANHSGSNTGNSGTTDNTNPPPQQ